MIGRDLERAQGQRHDLVVVGGGIYGALLTLEAARRGLRPLLLERDDFGEHTTANWLRILHGGLRYLQSLDLRRHVESVRERRWFMRHFPDLVEPLPCLMPLYQRGMRRTQVLRGALAANDLLSWYRNNGVRPDRHLAAGTILPPREVLALAPRVRPEGLAGGALWHDAVARQPQRLLMEILRWAVREGATVASHAEARDLVMDGGRVTGITARDRRADAPLRFSTGVVVNCAGPWSREVAARWDRDLPALFRPSLAFNLLLDRAADFEAALAVEAPRPGARTYFLLPWEGRVMAGTFHAPVEGAGAEAGPDPATVEAFLGELDEAVPGMGLGSSRVLHVLAGQLPVRRDRTVELSRRAVIHDHGRQGGPLGLLSVSGVKFTVARAVAERTLGLAARRGLLDPGRPSGEPPPSPPPDGLAGEPATQDPDAWP